MMSFGLELQAIFPSLFLLTKRAVTKNCDVAGEQMHTHAHTHMHTHTHTHIHIHTHTYTHTHTDLLQFYKTR